MRQPIILKNEPLAVLPTATLAIIQEPLAAMIADLVAFAEGSIQRSDMEAGLQAYALAVYELQEDCPECANTGQFLAHDGRLLWRCPKCGGKKWRYKEGAR